MTVRNLYFVTALHTHS